MKLLLPLIPLLALTSILSATEITHALPEFTVQLPAGFVENTAIRDRMSAQSKEKLLYYLYKGIPTTEDGISIIIYEMNAEMDSEVGKGMTERVSSELFVEPWGQHRIAVVRLEDEGRISLAAVIPLKHHAIRIILNASKKNQAEAENLLREILGTLKGPTNWQSVAASTSKEPQFSLFERLIIFVPIGLLVAFLTMKKPDSASKPKATSAETTDKNDSAA